MATITVRGRAERAFHPDVVVLSFGLRSERFVTTAEAAEQLDARTRDLRQRLDAVFPELLEPKTNRYAIEAVTEHVDGPNGSRPRRLFEGVHDLELRLSLDTARVNAVVVAARVVQGLTWRTSFEVADEAARRREAVALALQDARLKAEVLARAANAALGEIERVEYGVGHHDVVFGQETPAFLRFGPERDGPPPTPDLDPVPLKFAEEVVATWALHPMGDGTA